MTLDDALAVFRANEAARDDSFLDHLHERHRFDRDRFWTFCNAAIIVGASEHRHAQDIRDSAFAIYDYVLRAILWHFCPDDQHRIEGLPENLPDHLEVLAWALRGILRGRISPWDDPPIENPQAEALRAHFAPGRP